MGILIFSFLSKASEIEQNLTQKESPAQAKKELMLNVEEIIENHIKASGGREVLSKIKDQTIEAAISIQNLAGTVTIHQKAPNKIHTVTDLGIVKIETWYDGHSGWKKEGEVVSEITGKDLELLNRESDFYGLLNYKEKGWKVELLGEEKILDRDCFVINLILEDGAKKKIYIDCESYLIIKAISSVSTSQMGEIPVESYSSDYKNVEGMMLPFYSKEIMPHVTIETKIKEIRFNTGLEDSLFQMAKEKKKDEKQ